MGKNRCDRCGIEIDRDESIAQKLILWNPSRNFNINYKPIYFYCSVGCKDQRE